MPMRHPDPAPAAPVRDFDHHNCPGLTLDPFAAFDRYRDEPIFWTPAFGGYWVLTRYNDIRAVLRDTDAFSSRHTTIPAAGWPRPLIPNELDPPDHGRYRSALVRCLAGTVSGTVVSAIERECALLAEVIAPRGECDLVADFARPIAHTLFAALFDVPQADTTMCAQWVTDLLQHADSSRRLSAVGQIKGYLGRLIDDYRSNSSKPGGSGLIRTLTRIEQDGGASFSDADILDLGFLTVMASIDTVVNSVSFGFRYLAQNIDQQRRIADGRAHPTVVAGELLRLHSVVNVARTATRDSTVAGVRIRKGERMFLSMSMADRDPDIYPDPTTADFDRAASPTHLAFGAGPHRCPGSGIATQAFASALREWHRRIVGYAIAQDDTAPMADGGAVCSLGALRLMWPSS